MNREWHADIRPSFLQRIMSKYGYAAKLNFIFILIALAFLITGFFLVSDLQTQVSFAEKEIAGLKYESQIRTLYENLIKHKVIAYRYVSGEKMLKNELLELQTTISSEFQNLQRIDLQYQNQLKTRPEDFILREDVNSIPAELNRKWKLLTDSILSTDLAGSELAHQQLIDGFQNLLIYIGNNSKMFLDGSPATYYLIDLMVKNLPDTLNLIGDLMAQENILLKKNVWTPTETYKLTTLNTLIESNINSMQKELNIVYAEEGTVTHNLDSKTILSPIESSFIDTTNAFINSVKDKLIKSENTHLQANNLSPNEIDPAKFYELGNKAFANGFQLWNSMSGLTETLLKNRITDVKLKGYSILALVMSIIVISLIIGILVLRETNYFVFEVLTRTIKFAQGDLSQRAPPVYDATLSQLGGVLNHLADNIETLLNQIQSYSIQLTTSTTQIAAAAKHQEGTVCQQEATVKEILVTAGEISSTAKDFAKTMNEISKTAEETSSLASAGRSGLNKMESTMRLMVDASTNIASKLAVLNERANAITSVITTITKVADQTNLLSLNAAIEAEKAGEHGKSFSVIAREIRRLADQTANATLDIEKMISEMMAAVSEGVMGVDKFTEEIRTGVAQVSKTNEQLSLIIEQVQLLTGSFENVNKGMQTQSLGAEQINESIMQLSDAAQQTSHSIRQFHTAIEQLSLATKEMQNSVANMKKFEVTHHKTTPQKAAVL